LAVQPNSIPGGIIVAVATLVCFHTHPDDDGLETAPSEGLAS
jgi:hypothetical protein